MKKNEKLPLCINLLKEDGQKELNNRSINELSDYNNERNIFTEENVSVSTENDFSKSEMARLIRKNINFAISDKHNINDEQYKLYQIEALIKNKYCHLNTIFHDNNFNQLDEFLKRYD